MTDGATGSLEETNYHGVSEVTDITVLNYPETCTFAYNATAGAVDVSNGKDMSKVSYKFPKGLANYDDLSDIFSNFYFDRERARWCSHILKLQVSKCLTDLGLDGLLNNGGVTSV